jgi:hypothetical protein
MRQMELHGAMVSKYLTRSSARGEECKGGGSGRGSDDAANCEAAWLGVPALPHARPRAVPRHPPLTSSPS